jgi:hypothetical protein
MNPHNMFIVNEIHGFINALDLRAGQAIATEPASPVNFAALLRG